MMATAKPMGQQHQNKKYGNLAQECFTDGMVDHDMHLKMSKKIAQLTKVIYALNTKNDEHEQIVTSLQQQHEKEKLQLLDQTKAKLEELRSKLGAEVELREKISSLEHCVEEHERQKKRFLHEFDKFKGDTADREAQVKFDYTQQISMLSKQLQHYQIEFDAKASNFETLLGAFERDKDEAISDLRKAHQIEVDNLLRTQLNRSSSRDVEITKELETLRATFAAQREQSTNVYNDLKVAKDEMENDYDEKLKKSKALYEKELELLRHTQSEQYSEKNRNLQETMDKLTKDFQFQEAQYRHRIDSLLSDLSASEDLINSLKNDKASLSANNSKSDEERTSLLNQLELMKKEALDSLNKYREAERELQIIQQRCNDQSDQLVKKSGLIGELTAAKAHTETQLQKLTDELTDVSRKLKILQDEKNLLMSKSSSEAQQKSLEVQALEQALEDVRIEKRAQRDKYEADLVGLERTLEEHRVTSDKRLQDELSQLQKSHTEELCLARQEEQEKAEELEKKLKSELLEEVTRLETANQELKASLTAEIAELQAKLDAAESELERLNRMVGDTSNNLGAATSELTDLRSQSSILRQQLDRANSELNSTNSRLGSLTDEAEKLKRLNSQMVKDHERELKVKLEELNRSLEESWLEKLRYEMDQLKTGLENQFANDRASTIRHLNDRKNEEIQKISLESEAKIHQLILQITELERSLKEMRLSGNSKADSIREQYDQQIKDLTSEIEKISQDYEQRLADLSTSLEAQWSTKLQQQADELNAGIMELKNKHIEDMTSQMTAHKLSTDLIRKEAETLHISELEKLQSATFQEKDKIRSELELQYRSQQDGQKQAHLKQVTALKMELQRAVELRKQKESELQLVKDEHGETLSQRDRSIQVLEGEIRQLEQSIQTLDGEIQKKGRQLVKVKSDANKELRQREEFLAQEHAEDMEKIQGHHADEMQQVVVEFTRAQSILKNKIEELAALLEEAEERYLNREPREEDLNMIQQLRRVLTEREEEMQQLLADKQYFQMELVNRETNFTKVFAGGKGGPQQPQVGFINPLAKKKKGEKGPTKYAVNVGGMDGGISGHSSASSTTQRLRPIAGSPSHDERLNPNHVLPPPHAFTKKFVQ